MNKTKAVWSDIGENQTIALNAITDRILSSNEIAESFTNFGTINNPGTRTERKTVHISALKQSKYLTRADVGSGILVTIKDIFQDNVAKEGAPEELKWVISFNEVEKPMVLNATNGQIIASIVKSEETDTWFGHKIVLYDDPNVSFGGKLVGGIRCRAPRNQPARPAPARPRAVSAPKQAAPAARSEPGPAAEQDGREEDPEDAPF